MAPVEYARRYVCCADVLANVFLKSEGKFRGDSYRFLMNE